MKRRHFVGFCLAAFVCEAYVLWFTGAPTVEARGRKPYAVEAFGQGVPVAQTFVMNDDGLDSIELEFETASPTTITVECRLVELGRDPSRPPQELWRRPVVLDSLSGTERRTILFDPLASSANRLYSFQVRLLSAEPTDASARAPAAVGIVAFRDDVLPGGSLFVEDQEQWGDLSFAVRGASRSNFGWFRRHAAVNLPPIFQGVVVQLILLVAYNAVLVAFAWQLIVRGLVVAPAGASEPPVAEMPSGRSRGHLVARVLAGAAAVAMAGGVAAWLVHRSLDRGIDLIDAFDTAEKQTDLSLHGAFVAGETTINGDTLDSIFAHPASRIAWSVTVPPRGRLVTSLALAPDVWNLPGDGVLFQIAVVEGEVPTSLHEQVVNPFGSAEDRRWIPVSIDLSALAGRVVQIVFTTEGSPPDRPSDTSHDWAVWGAPRIVQGQ